MRWRTYIAFYSLVTLAWLGLAQQLSERHSAVDFQLKSEVRGLWGQTHFQRGPSVKNDEDYLEILEAEVEANLQLSHRQKGMLWYSTYLVDFRGRYTVAPGATCFEFPLPVKQGMFSEFKVTVNGQEADWKRGTDSISLQLPNDTETIDVSYRGQGLDRWAYEFVGDSSVRNLNLVVKTDFHDYDFPDGSLSAINQEQTQNGAELTWVYRELLTGGVVAVEVPQVDNPGPKQISICRYAPGGLALFLIMLTLMSSSLGHQIEDVQIVFCTLGYFGFHALLIYLADHLGLIWALVIASGASFLLVQSYLARLWGLEFVLRVGIWIQALYLVGYSMAFLNSTTRGLLLISLVLLTLAVVMHLSVGLKKQTDSLEPAQSWY